MLCPRPLPGICLSSGCSREGTGASWDRAAGRSGTWLASTSQIFSPRPGPASTGWPPIFVSPRRIWKRRWRAPAASRRGTSRPVACSGDDSSARSNWISLLPSRPTPSAAVMPESALARVTVQRKRVVALARNPDAERGAARRYQHPNTRSRCVARHLSRILHHRGTAESSRKRSLLGSLPQGILLKNLGVGTGISRRRLARSLVPRRFGGQPQRSGWMDFNLVPVDTPACLR
jgi:hypothetical protein